MDMNSRYRKYNYMNFIVYENRWCHVAKRRESIKLVGSAYLRIFPPSYSLGFLRYPSAIGKQSSQINFKMGFSGITSLTQPRYLLDK